MTTQTQYPHLTVDAQNVARIGDTRYKVIHLASEHYHHGWSAEELLRQHPDLRPEQVYAALTYFYDHFAPLVAEMEKTAEEFDAARASQPLSREELLRRKAPTE